MRGVVRTFLFMLVALTALAGALVYTVASRGLCTRVQPRWIEERAARGVRQLATSSAVRDMSNPVTGTPAVFEDGLAHFADHCASCHGNDGSGTDLGKSFYPPVPDMRAARTQNLTDGELFSIIENGIRLTGMPAWGNGTPEGEASSWALVHFIRRLPALSPGDIARMQELNPKSPAEFREEEEARRFLAGDEPIKTSAPAERQGHH